MLTRPCLSIALAALFAASAPAHADPAERLTAEVDAALLRLADSGELPVEDALRIEQPPRIRRELGAVLDLAAGSRGAPVLAVSPGSAAERIGLRLGDRVLVLNGLDLRGAVDAAQLHAAVEAGEGGLVLTVERDGSEQQLRGLADSTTLPGYQLLLAGVADVASSCGRLSVFDVFPRSQDVFPVTVIAIDGRYPGPGPSFRLEPGPHVVTVAERIDAYEFTPIETRLRSSGGRSAAGGLGTRGEAAGIRGHELSEITPPAERMRSKIRSAYKDIELVVQPGVTHRLAAQLHEASVSSVRQNTYWTPIVWKESSELCR